MYERMLNKQVVLSIVEMTEYCAENAESFSMINDWMTTTFSTEQKEVFPMVINMIGVLDIIKRNGVKER